MKFTYTIKKKFWKYAHKPLMWIRDRLVNIGVIKHVGRQNFVLGKLKENTDMSSFTFYLINNYGFEIQNFAWIDSDQVVSLRKPHMDIFQYHLRVYQDGEVRGHYEFAPEARALDHFLEIGFHDRSDDFMEWIREFIE